VLDFHCRPISSNTVAVRSFEFFWGHVGKLINSVSLLAFGVALGSSTQIALFVIPFMVLVAWGMDKPLDLFFGSFETAVIFMAALIVSHVVADGESNWLEGVMLLVAYCIICVAFFFYTPDEAPLSASPGVE